MINSPFITFSQSGNIQQIIRDSSYFKYNKLIDSALFFRDKEPHKAFEYFDSAFQIKNYIFLNQFYAFDIAMKAGSIDKAYNYIYEGVKNGGLNISEFSSKSIDDFFNTDIGKQFSIIQDSLFQVYWKKIDTLYFKNLEELYRKDQSNRIDEKVFNVTDSINFSKLITLSEKKGFPTYKTTGIGLHYAETVLWHQRSTFPNSPMWKQIIPFINDQISNGNLDPYFLDPYFDQMPK